MDISMFIGLIAAIFGGGAVVSIIFYGVERRKREGDARKAVAEAGSLEAATQQGVIGMLWNAVDKLGLRVDTLEKRVAALEEENLGLRRVVARFRDLVESLWQTIVESGVDVPDDLACEVRAVLEDEKA